jgi:hypothetical protein
VKGKVVSKSCIIVHKQGLLCKGQEIAHMAPTKSELIYWYCAWPGPTGSKLVSIDSVVALSFSLQLCALVIKPTI